MIRAITGMPGGGKTVFLAHIAKKELKKGRPVYSNIAIKGTYKITFDDLLTYTFPIGAVILIDEAGRHFNSRRWKELPDEIFDLFTLHRHLQLDMYVCAQNFGYIDAQLRKVIELTYWAKNLPILPFFRYEGYYDLEKLGNMKNPDVTTIVWKTRKLYHMYDTHSMSAVYHDKETIPDNAWFKYPAPYKSIVKILWQKLRIKVKRKWYKRKWHIKQEQALQEGFDEE